MTDGFTKLFNSIITSSIWSEDDKVRIMWITMLASADASGFVTGAIPGMAAMARMSLKDAEKSIKALTKPDPYSRSTEYEGRRLLECEGGWIIVNYTKYRQKRDPEKRREQNREAQRRFKLKHGVSKSKPKVSRDKPGSAQAEAEADKNNYIGPGCGKKPVAETTTQTQVPFEKFWLKYPTKVDRKRAEEIWDKLSPDKKLVEEILLALEKHKAQDSWHKENGKYVPKPSNWLSDARWKDELSNPQASPDYSAALNKCTHDCTEAEAEELMKEVASDS